MSKPGTPVKQGVVRRLSKTGSTVTEEIPLSTSMEVLTPPASSPAFAALTESKDGKSRPRTPVGSTPPSPAASRKSRSAEGRKSIEVVRHSASESSRRLDLQAIQKKATEMNNEAFLAMANSSNAASARLPPPSPATPTASKSVTSSIVSTSGELATASSAAKLPNPSILALSTDSPGTSSSSKPTTFKNTCTTGNVSDRERTIASDAVHRAGYEHEPPDTPASVVSVASGKSAAQSGFFLTGLRKAYSYDLAEESPAGTPQSRRQDEDAASLMSAVNPMQSPTASAFNSDDEDEFFSTPYDEDSDYDDAAFTDPAFKLNMSTALSDYSNPMMTPATLSKSLDDAPVSTAAMLDLVQQLYVEPPSPAPQDSTTQPATPLEQQEEVHEGESAPAEDDSPGGARPSSALDEHMQRQDARRAELQEYLTYLEEGCKHKEEDGTVGEKMVEINNREHLVELEKLIRAKRHEYRTLQGWLGPTKFEDLPINQLPASHDDPKVEEGLAAIRELDQVLQEKTIEALITERETFPERWQEREKKWLEYHTKTVDNILKSERRRRAKASRLAHAVNALVADGIGEGQDDMRDTVNAAARQVYSRYLKLSAAEEELVAAIQARSEEELSRNPFELDIIIEDNGEGDVRSIADIDAKLAEFANEHVYDAHGSIVDTLSLYGDEGSVGVPATPGNVTHTPMSRAGAASVIAASTTTTITAAGHRDYLRENREAKELHQREADLDAQLRALRTSELPPKLGPEQLAALIEQCKTFQFARLNSVPSTPTSLAPPTPVAQFPPASTSNPSSIPAPPSTNTNTRNSSSEVVSQTQVGTRAGTAGGAVGTKPDSRQRSGSSGRLRRPSPLDTSPTPTSCSQSEGGRATSAGGGSASTTPSNSNNSNSTASGTPGSGRKSVLSSARLHRTNSSGVILPPTSTSTSTADPASASTPGTPGSPIFPSLTPSDTPSKPTSGRRSGRRDVGPPRQATPVLT